MDVYFADSNPTTYDVMSDEIDNLSFTVEVMRLNSAEAATVPLTVFSRSEAFECPSTIEFAAGENKAALEVKVNKVSSGDYTLELSIGDVRYSNPYVTTDGADVTSYYDPETQTYYFNMAYNVSAGTFGTMYEKFVLTDPVQ